MDAPRTVEIHVKRQETSSSSPHWETFAVPYEKGMNVTTVLQRIAQNPTTIDSHPTTPVSYETNCLEEVCGACTMVINGKVRQACTALIDHLTQPIRLEPMSKFPLVRDLWVNRQTIFDNLKKVKAWIPVDGSYDLGPGPKVSPEDQQMAYALSRCMTCGCCMEVCPQFNERSDFMGAAIMNAVVLYNSHPTGNMNKNERLEPVMGKGGVADCGDAQNCVKACPKEIPLTTSIAELGRQTSVRIFEKFFKD
jgi:succinate dehydrogenase / fumarate reductase, iron-sulfur subunit